MTILSRQVTARYVRNCMSRMYAIAYSRVVPISVKCDHPKGIMNGSIQVTRLVESITGIFMRPIKK